MLLDCYHKKVAFSVALSALITCNHSDKFSFDCVTINYLLLCDATMCSKLIYLN